MQPRIDDKVGYHLIHTFQCNKLSDRAQGKLHYQLWQHNESNTLGIALSHNESTGGFSAELILTEDILMVLGKLHKEQKPFHATVFKELFIGKSVNNASFLGAVLVDRQVIRLHPQTTRLLEVMEDYQEWPTRLQEISVVDTAKGNTIQPKKKQGKAITTEEELTADADRTA